MPYLSALLGRRIEDEHGQFVGRVTDVVAVPGAKFPVVNGIMAASGRGKHRERFFLPWPVVSELKPRAIVAREQPDHEAAPAQGDVFLARDLLDKQIVDMEGYKIVRVNDIRIARSGGELRVMGADVSGLALLRRLGLGWVTDKLPSDNRYARDRIVPWNLVSPVGPMPYDLRLSVPYRQYTQIHPSDIADIIEQLDEQQRAKVLAWIEDPKAAEVLTHILPDVRSSVAEAIGDQRLSDLLEIMPPDEAADILGTLPREKAQILLSLMGIEEASVVRELLGYEPDTAGGRMTTEFVSVPYFLTTEQAIEHLRRVGQEAETIYYVYVVDGDGHLSGVLSLRDLLRSAPGEEIGGIMMRDVIAAEVDDDQEAVADKLSRYNLLAVPVLDEDHVLKGIVTVDDAIDVILEETTEDFSQLSGVPFEEEGAPISDVLDLRRWAGITLTFLGGVLATALFGIFKAAFVAALGLVYFVPLALRSAQDISVWSLASAVRDLRGVEPGRRRLRGMMAREYIFAIVAAVLISSLAFLLALVWTGSTSQAGAGAVGLFVGLALAGTIGLAAPLVVRHTEPDPAVGLSRLVSVTVMAAAIVSYVVVAGLLVHAWR